MKQLSWKLFAALLLAAAAASSAEKSAAPQPEALVDRALATLAQMREYSMEVERVAIQTSLGSGAQTILHRIFLHSFRAPDLTWSELLSSYGARGASVANGKVVRDFFLTPHNEKFAGGFIKERPLKKGESMQLGRHSFNALSPAVFADSGGTGDAAPARHLFDVIDPEQYYTQKKYLGQHTVRGEVCDVVEFSRSMPEQAWTWMRAHYAGLPEKSAYRVKFYLRATDGRILREERLEWALFQVEGKWPEPGYPNTRTDITVDFEYTAPLPADQFTVRHLTAVVNGATAGKPPKVETESK